MMGHTSPFGVGDRVVDREDDEPRSEAVVVKKVDTRADQTPIDVLDATVAQLNPEHPAEAPVVRVAFVEEVEEDLAAPLDEYHDEEVPLAVNGNNVRTYDYPVTRLAAPEEVGQ